MARRNQEVPLINFDPAKVTLAKGETFDSCARDYRAIAANYRRLGDLDGAAELEEWADSIIAHASSSSPTPAATTQPKSASPSAPPTAHSARVSMIMALPEARGREAVAKHLAYSTDLSAETIKRALVGLQSASAQTVANQASGAATRSWDRVVERVNKTREGAPVVTAATAVAPATSWDKVIAAVNARFDASQQARPSTAELRGWDKAVAAVNARIDGTPSGAPL